MRLDLNRMRAWAEAAHGHPTWSVAYAEDVPKLAGEIERLRGFLQSEGYREDAEGHWEKVTISVRKVFEELQPRPYDVNDPDQEAGP